MKATELRVGNLVKAKHTNGNPNKWVVIKVKPEHIVTCSDNPKWFKPIPLTEEWILKCGFKKIFETRYPHYHIGGIDGFDIKVGFGKAWWFGTYKSSLALANIKYVNQLQNIIYYLTNKELNP